MTSTSNFVRMDKFYPYYIKDGHHKLRIITPDFLLSRVSPQYGKQKWIIFCEALLDRGIEVGLYEARKSRSKYIHAKYGKKVLKFRFSNHRPHESRLFNDCDFFVGVSGISSYTTNDALNFLESIFQLEF